MSDAPNDETPPSEESGVKTLRALLAWCAIVEAASIQDGYLLLTLDSFAAPPGSSDEAKALLRGEIARRSEHRYDRGQADRLCRAVQRGWMVAVIRRHPRAERFQSLVDAINRGRYSEKQRDLALKLIAEVA